MAEQYWLDDHGDQILSAWLNKHPDPGDVALILQLLDDLSWGRPMGEHFYALRDLTQPGVWEVRLRARLVAVIKLYSDEDPACRFSVTYIGSPLDG